MRHHLLLLSALLLLFFSVPVPAPAQQTREGEPPRETVRIPGDVFSVEEVLSKGRQLEQKERWSEALSHYEKATRDYPNEQSLTDRLSAVRRRFNVTRRYADRSYLAVVRRGERESTDIYSEILRKIHTHYVDEPRWRAITARGVMQLETALQSTEFHRVHMERVKSDAISSFQRSLKSRLSMLPIRDRHEALDAAVMAGRLAEKQLGVPPQAVILEFACGAVDTLDAYSAFLTKDQLDDSLSQIEGNFVGLGIELKAEGNSLLIVNVITGGPAHEAGMRRGDRIVEVDRKTMDDVTTDEAAEMLRGVEGSTVDVVIVKQDQSSQQVRMMRRRVDVPSIEEVQLIDRDAGVGYFKLTSFQKNTRNDLDRALWQLHRQGMRSLIVDVRNNPGGLLPAAIEVADRFISRGIIVSTRGRSPNEDFDYHANGAGTWRVPLLVLVDGDSASASEIFAGAIRDHDRGDVVGQRTYGKGSVQGIFPLSYSRAGVRLTTAKFYSPAGHAISDRGVVPNVDVQIRRKAVAEKDPASETDSVLQTAIKIAQDKYGAR
ncbi:MAG: S41 family peptidase [Pirellulaceae bacterium]|jgi:carboxyl-terminal processing protease|nr:S41 family peptidase [Pirellulaceae bacterium]MDP7014664.1 S41 family peptidase [Pirellulaceae bacterium]